MGSGRRNNGKDGDAAAQFKLRRGQPSDQSTIMQAMVAQAMNPLFLDPLRFLVAEGLDGSILGRYLLSHSQPLLN